MFGDTSGSSAGSHRTPTRSCGLCVRFADRAWNALEFLTAAECTLESVLIGAIRIWRRIRLASKCSPLGGLAGGVAFLRARPERGVHRGHADF